jgi:hypothetical protein
MEYTRQEKLFDFAIVLTYILYAIILLGINKNAKTYIDTLSFFIKLYVSLFLILRFNYFRKNNNKFTRLDKKMAFSAGCFLILTTIVNEAIIKFI